MWLRKTSGVPGAAPGGLEWQTLKDVLEVDDVLGAALLDIPGAGFVEAPAPADAADTPDPANSNQAPEPAEVGEAPTARRGRPRKTTDTEVSE